MQRILLVVFLHLCAGAVVLAQRDTDVHGSVGMSFGVPLDTLSPIPGIPSPGPLSFESQETSIRPFMQAGADVVVTPLFRAGGRIGYTSLSLNYVANESVPIATEQGEVYLATIRHDLSMSFSSLWLEPYLRMELLPWLGAQVGIPLNIPFNSSYLQTQEFTDPPGLPFEDGSTRQVTGSGPIPGMSAIVPGISLQADGMFPMMKGGALMLHPSVGISTQITSWNSGSALRTLSFNLGVGVRYRFITPPPPPEPFRDTTLLRDTVVILSQRVSAEVVELVSSKTDEIRHGDTVDVIIKQRYQRIVPKPPAVLQASLKLSFESEVGGITREARLIVTTVERTRTVPILPIVVFDSLDVRIPNRYRRLTSSQAQQWSERKAMTDPTTHWQYYVLNVIGDRLRRQSSSKVDLIVYDDGTEEGTRVARERAEAVQRYITATFGVAERRIKIDVRHGQASQQPWVFFGDETRTLLKPLVVTDTISESRLPRVRLSPDVVSEAGIRTWTVSVYNHGSLIKKFEGTGQTPATLIWDMSEDVSPDEAFQASITTELSVVDLEGTSRSSAAARITPSSPSVTELGKVAMRRFRVLRWIGADYLHTPDVELFGLNPVFDRVDVYPSPSRREDFFVANVPAIVHPVNADAWFRRNLVEPERGLFDHAESYVKEERIR